MTRTVQIDLSVADAQAVQAWQRSKDSVMAYQNAVGGIDKQNKKASQSGDRFFNSTARGLKTLAASYLSVQAAMKLVSLEFEAVIERDRRASQTQKSLAGLDADLIQSVTSAGALGGNKAERARNILRIRDDLADATNLTAQQVTGTLTQAESSRGNLTALQAAETAGFTLALNPQAVESAQAQTSLALTLQQQGIGAKSALGFSLAAGQTLPAAQQGTLATGLARVAGPAAGLSATLPEITALFSSLSGRTGDTELKKAANTSVQFASQIDELVPGEGSLFSKIDQIRNNQELLPKTLRGEAQFKPLLRRLLNPNDEIGSQIRKELGSISESLPRIGKQSSQFFDESYLALRESPNIRLDALDRTFSAFVDERQRGNIKGGERAVLREGLDSSLAELPGSTAIKKFALARYDAATQLGNVDPFDAALDAIDRKRQEFAPSREAIPTQGGVIYQTNPGNPEMLAAIRELTEELRESRESQGKVPEFKFAVDIKQNGQPKEGQIVNPAPKRPAARVGRRKKLGSRK